MTGPLLTPCACVGGGSNPWACLPPSWRSADIYAGAARETPQLGSIPPPSPTGAGRSARLESIMPRMTTATPARSIPWPAAWTTLCGAGTRLLHDIGRVNYVTATDEEAVDALFKLSCEGIIPALKVLCHCVCHEVGRKTPEEPFWSTVPVAVTRMGPRRGKSGRRNHQFPA
ncbi:MAG: hypothetical protein ACLSUW_03875 [Akkermansia sp.]